MTVKEIRSELLEKKSLLKEIFSQQKKINSEIDNLKITLEEKYKSLLLEYFPVGSVIEFQKLANFNGVQISKERNSKNELPPEIQLPIFRIGDKIEILKHNKKSVVIKIIQHNKYIWNSITKNYDLKDTFYPNTKYRIELDGFYYFFISDQEFMKRFEVFISRKESLAKLDI